MNAQFVCLQGPVEVRYSQLDRFGVFATANIPTGSILHEAPVLVLERGWETVPTVLNHYLFAWPKDGDGRAIGFGIASLLNHSSQPNATWETDPLREVLIFFALRAIAQGEEVLVDYGADYWPNHDQYPQRYPVDDDQQPHLNRHTNLQWHA